MKFRVVILLTVAFVAVSCKKNKKPTIEYVNLWQDETGETHLSVCELNEFDLGVFYKNSDKSYMATNLMPTKDYVLNIFPKNWFGDWHTAPSLQWIITLTGNMFIRASDGSVVDLPPGSFTFNNDMNSTIGHQSGVSENSGTASAIFVQVTRLPEKVLTHKCSAGGYWKCDLKPEK